MVKPVNKGSAKNFSKAKNLQKNNNNTKNTDEKSDLKGLPPGLQRKVDSGKGLPPGLQKKLDNGQDLPPGLKKKVNKNDNEKQTNTKNNVKNQQNNINNKNASTKGNDNDVAKLSGLVDQLYQGNADPMSILHEIKGTALNGGDQSGGNLNKQQNYQEPLQEKAFLNDKIQKAQGDPSCILGSAIDELSHIYQLKDGSTQNTLSLMS